MEAKIAGEGIAPSCKAYEAWLDLSPVEPAMKKMAAGRGYRRSGFGQSRENPLPARARIGGLPDLRQCWSERGAFLQQPEKIMWT